MVKTGVVAPTYYELGWAIHWALYVVVRVLYMVFHFRFKRWGKRDSVKHHTATWAIEQMRLHFHECKNKMLKGEMKVNNEVQTNTSFAEIRFCFTAWYFIITATIPLGFFIQIVKTYQFFQSCCKQSENTIMSLQCRTMLVHLSC